MVEEWKKVPILFNCKKLWLAFENLTSIIMQNVVKFRNMIEMNVAKKLVHFGINGVTIFQRVKTSVTA
jgi:hypothetical protein